MYSSAALDCPGIPDGEHGSLRFYCTNGKRLVLDYDRPLPEQPAGQWIVHEGSGGVALPAAVGAALIDGDPVMLEAGTATETATWTPGPSFADDGEMVLKDWLTGRMSPGGYQGELDVDWVHLSSTRLGGESSYRYTLTPDTGVDEIHDDAVSAVSDVGFRAAVFRTRDVRMRVTETAATGEGRAFDGVAMEILPYGRLQNLYRKVA